ncbi:MAG: glycosyltransferase, partial [Candidatus Omnitrophica bacterium]|nr:glycosyltransferase [Candidatus Omnitrophota bacterium]
MLRLSVIVPTYNNQDTIDECFSSIKKSHFKNYELIVADCASEDLTRTIAKKYVDRVLKFPRGCGRNYARRMGAQAAGADIIVNIDSDILIKEDTLEIIADYFSAHHDCDAITGSLSKTHPNNDFFSQYKNLYMHYRFSRLPSRVGFLYGAIFAFRKHLAALYDKNVSVADDTAFGRNLVSRGKIIAFLNDLQVMHLKRYDFFGLMRNDFVIASDWANIFLKHRAWRFIAREKGFAHSSLGQMCSILIVFLVCGFFALYFLSGVSIVFLWCALLLWVFFNVRFFSFLGREKGPVFFLFSCVTSFLTDIAKAAGIACGV